jgi:hypothetical protein
MEYLDKIIECFHERGNLQNINRISYPYDISCALQVVEAIGKQRKEKFVIDEQNKFVYENILRWIHADESMMSLSPAGEPIIGDIYKGIYIAGPTGTGKSWLLDIMSEYAGIFRFKIEIGQEQIPMCWKNIRTDEICDEYSKDGKIGHYKRCKIIGFQDLGSEQPETLYMGNRINVMRSIIEYRGDSTDSCTLITSNLPIRSKQMETMYGDRVVSRLHEMCNYYELKGRDRRKT